MAAQQFVHQSQEYAQEAMGCEWDAMPKAQTQQVSSFAHDDMIYRQPEQQPSGGSPSGSSVSSDSAMEYSQCSPSQQLQQQQAQLNRNDSSSFAGMDDGWFSKCRGCGCMTAHEQAINGSDVPFCKRCQVTLDAACPRMRGKMVDTLLYVHEAWSNAGL